MRIRDAEVGAEAERLQQAREEAELLLVGEFEALGDGRAGVDALEDLVAFIEALEAIFGAGVDDIDLSLEDFTARVNSDLVGKLVNIAAD